MPAHKKNQNLWISWETHRRTRELCKHFDLPLYEFTYNGNRLLKYLFLISKTTLCLLTQRPRILLIQNPSIVLAFFATLMRKAFGYSLIVDAHNEAVEPYNYPNAIVNWACRFILKHAEFTIVTNTYLGEIVIANGGHPIILPDKLPSVPPLPAPARSDQEQLVMVLIATFAKDEPITEILEAAGQFKDKIQLMITGNPKRFLTNTSCPIPDNVTFTGFLPDDAYWSLLVNADAIIDLTTKDNCLVCGAYEGVAAGTPLILSDNPATREYFSSGVIYTKAETAEIAQAMNEVQARQQDLKEGITRLRNELETRWQRFSTTLQDKL